MTVTIPTATPQAGLRAQAARWLTPSLTDVFFIALVLWIFASGPMGWTALLAEDRKSVV